MIEFDLITVKNKFQFLFDLFLSSTSDYLLSPANRAKYVKLAFSLQFYLKKKTVTLLIERMFLFCER